MIDFYDRGMSDPVTLEYYGNTDYYNYGYWDDGTTDQGEASANLVEKLVGLIPEKKGRILDVACGLGASTRYLRNHYPDENIVAVNLSDFQLDQAKSRARSLQFACMDAAHLAFESNSFDAILCVEAAFHFDTRDLFLHEA